MRSGVGFRAAVAASVARTREGDSHWRRGGGTCSAGGNAAVVRLLPGHPMLTPRLPSPLRPC
eukprot:94464-Chlamydomonas_euryale.AAC.1